MKLLITIFTLAVACSQATAGDLENQAAALLTSFGALSAPSVSAIEVPAPAALKAPAQNWAEAAKAAAEREMDAGGFIGFTDLQELPPGVRNRLEREWEILPEGPGNSSEAFKLNVNGRTAFIVQSYIYSDSMRLYVFDAAGNSVAYGEGSADTDFAWLPIPSLRKGMPALKDAFQGLPGCSVVDAMFFKQPTMTEAIEMLSGCLKDVKARYGFPVKADIMTAPFGGPGNGPQGSTRSITLEIPKNLPVGNRLLSDLNFSLEKRGNQLFGYPAALRQTAGN